MRTLWGTFRTPIEDFEETFMKALDILEVDHGRYGTEVVVEIYLEPSTEDRDDELHRDAGPAANSLKEDRSAEEV